MAKHNTQSASTTRIPKQSLEESSSAISLAPWGSLSPSTGDAVAMVEAFLGQYEQSNPSSPSAAVSPPEQQDAAYPRTAMPLGKFIPIRGADYTESFVGLLQDEFRRKGEASFRQVPIWLSCLSLPSRQRLIFREEFIAKRNTVQINFHTYRRAMQIHRVGVAQRTPCNDCQRGLGPFPRCVIDADGDALKGACANCAYREQGHTCGYHQKYRNQSAISSPGVPPFNSIITPSRRFDPTLTRSNVKGKRPADVPQEDVVTKRLKSSPKNSDPPKAAGSNMPASSTAATTTTLPRKSKRQKRPKSPPAIPNSTSGPIITSDVVFQDTTFVVGQASIEQVQYILKRCHGDQRAFFTGAWLSWCAERRALGRPQSFNGIETFLSVGWYEDLNEMISKVCPVRSG